MKTKYRLLGPNETVQESDELNSSLNSYQEDLQADKGRCGWSNSTGWVGDKVAKVVSYGRPDDHLVFRRLVGPSFFRRFWNKFFL